MNDLKSRESQFIDERIEKPRAMTNVEASDQEIAPDVERTVILRVSTKHINFWIRQLEMKRKEICELAGLMGLDEVMKEIGAEKNLEKSAKRCTNHFTRKTKRMIFGETDNIVWSWKEGAVSKWCKRKNVCDEITDAEIDELWNREAPGDDEAIRLNGKYVWETAKRVCDYINAHEDIIDISSFGEYEVAMKKGMNVIKEAHFVERKRRQTAREEKSEEAVKRTQRAKALIATIKRGKMRKEDVMKRLDEIF